MRRFYFLIFSVCVLFCVACADDPISPSGLGSITGTVTDVETGLTVENVSMTTLPATEAVVSDSSGAFIFPEVKAGNYTVRGTKSGYKTTAVTVDVSAGEEVNADIVLSVSNLDPDTPENPRPANGQNGLSPSLTLAWNCSDPNPADTLVYDVYFSSGGGAVSLLAEGVEDTLYTVNNLKFNTTYNWQVAAKDGRGGVVYGPVWNFTTMDVPLNAIVYAALCEGQYDIYLSTADSQTVVRLTDDPALDWWPKINPQRTKIAFVSRRDVAAHIYSMDMDGSNVRKVTQTPIEGYHNHGLGFCWSPDGQYLLYSNYNRLLRVDDDGQNLTQIAIAPQNRHFRECAWSPAGNRLAVITQGASFYETELFMMTASGSNMTIIADDTAGVLRHPSFSPDGETLLYTYDLSSHQDADERQLNAHIFLYTIADGSVKDLSANKTAGYNDLYPVWAPHGGKILFVSELSDGSAGPALYLMNSDGSSRSRVLSPGIMPDWR